MRTIIAIRTERFLRYWQLRINKLCTNLLHPIHFADYALSLTLIRFIELSLRVTGFLSKFAQQLFEHRLHQEFYLRGHITLQVAVVSFSVAIALTRFL